MSAKSNEASDAVYDLSTLVLDRNSVNSSGGFADVYVANHPQLGPLALKRPRGVCNPGSREYRHLEQEALIWKDLKHPNVLRFLGIYHDNGAIYLVSPFLHNGTVPQYLSQHPDGDRAGFVRDLVEGLDYLHRCGIIHGDIKGGNMLVAPSLRGALADFGLAKLVDTQTVSSQRGMGTTRWQSPELLMEGQSRSFQSDVYAFGMTVYEIISGRVPFADTPEYGVPFKIYSKERPPTEPRVSSTGYLYTREWAVAQAAWNHNPQLRPNMAWILTSLQELAKGLEWRIKVVCDQTPQYDGYISQTFDEASGSHVVTQTAEDALIIAWDPTFAGPTALEMVNNTQNQRWLALRFIANSPNLKRDKILWATFTAASGTEHDYKVVPTPSSTGKELVVTWTWSDGNLTANALGETLEAGLNRDLDPPHLFFCHRMKNHWAYIKGRVAVRFVLEPLESKD